MKSDPHISCRRKPASVDLAALEAFAEALRKRVAHGCEFHCLLTNDAELQSLNRQFLGKNYATDALSFPEDGGDPSGDIAISRIGDIAISVMRARAQARAFGHSVDEELKILLLHGVLHLTGLDHETDSGEMKRAEIRWRKKFGLSVSLIERTDT